MTVFDHLGITVNDLARGIAQFDPVMQALGFGREDAAASVAWWREGEVELILFPAREPADERHVHGRAGWQHLAFATDSRAEVERLHAIALAAGWTEVRPPQVFPRFNERYFASFVEDDSGIRLEFMHNPPRES
ncbi:VOC family protein [Microbacterium sp.]|uniref:VOC family protein n=1 Tax=Microbacterium sp. TaxID=51671 RepID=UPI003F7042BF